MPDAITLIKQWAELIGATYREFPAFQSEAAFVLVRGNGVELLGTAPREPEGCNTPYHAADALAQALYRWNDAVFADDSESPEDTNA